VLRAGEFAREELGAPGAAGRVHGNERATPQLGDSLRRAAGAVQVQLELLPELDGEFTADSMLPTTPPSQAKQ
jgi:hypothetical protein